MDFNEIDSLFLKILSDIELIMKDDFYIEKSSLLKIKVIIKKWYDEFKIEKSLKTIDVKNLEFISLEITDLFDIYFKTESVTNNFVERLLYDFSILEKVWKDEMLGGK